MPPGRGPSEDLADGLDRLDVGVDGHLQPGIRRLRLPRTSPQGRASRAGRRLPRDVLACVGREGLAGARAAASRAVVGTTTSTITWRSPRDPRRRWGTPLPRSRISVLGWVPGLISTSSFAVHGRHHDLGPESRLGDRDLGLVEELGPLARQRRVRPDVDRHVQAARLIPARRPFRPRSRGGSGGLRSRAGRDRDAQRSLAFGPVRRRGRSRTGSRRPCPRRGSAGRC